MSSDNLDEFLEEAKGKGMHVIDNNKLADSYKNFEEEVAKADALSETPDPEETPYLSKYKARDILDMLCSRLEANRTIASLEKDAKIVYETNWRIAALRVRLGSLAWEVEEPHNTQVELELAAVNIRLRISQYILVIVVCCNALHCVSLMLVLFLSINLDRNSTARGLLELSMTCLES